MAIIADIQRASIHDGPGYRTTIFFKGCPLKCAWCHNPECIDFKPQIMNYPEKCIGCGQCDKGCFSGAKVVCGKEMTTDEVLRQILIDKDYYGENGGVTFSGGEPMAHKEFLYELIEKCKINGINTAIETSLIYFDEEILKSVDLVMADFKIWDEESHIKYTGVSNKNIIENFKKLDSLDISYIVRTPVIEGVTDIEEIEEFLKTLKNMTKHEKLKYHPLGIEKAKALGLEQERF